MNNTIWQLLNKETGEIVQSNFIFSNARQATGSAKRYAKYRHWTQAELKLIFVKVETIATTNAFPLTP